MLPLGDFSTYVGNTMNSWVASDIRLETVCGFEKFATSGFIVVPQASATALCQNYLALPADHSGISKPDDVRADVHLFLKTAVKNVSNATSGIITVDVKRIVDASNLRCDATGKRVDKVAIDDDLHFIDSPPGRYLARAETSSQERVQFLDPVSGIAIPTANYVSGDLTYHSALVPVVNGATRVRYQWENAHSGDELEVWARPAALLRNFEATIRLPPGVALTPKSVTPSSSTCKFSDEGRSVTCKELASRDVPIVITWKWDVWDSCVQKRRPQGARPPKR